MTAAMLNNLRRDALEEMRKARIQPAQTDRWFVPKSCEMPKQERLLIVPGENVASAKTLLECGADRFEWQPQIYKPDVLSRMIEEDDGVKPALVLPVVMYSDELEHIHTWVCENAERLSGVVANNPGQLALSWPVPVSGGQGLNVMNHACAEFYTALNVNGLTVSCELNQKELRELFASGGNYVMEAYGRTQLMLLNHCPRRTEKGDEKQDSRCDACARLGGCPEIYTDRKGYRFPLRRLQMEHGCVLRLYNSVETDMAKYAEKLQHFSVSIRLAWTDESPERQRRITASYRSVMDTGRALHEISPTATAGQLLRGVQ